MLHLVQTLAQVATSNPSPFEWVATHIQLVGWPTLCYFIGKAAWSIASSLAEIKVQIVKTVGQIDTLATNHMPHMEASLARQDEYMKSMMENLQRLADKL